MESHLIFRKNLIDEIYDQLNLLENMSNDDIEFYNIINTIKNKLTSITNNLITHPLTTTITSSIPIQNYTQMQTHNINYAQLDKMYNKN